MGETEEAILRLAREQPTLGQAAVARQLQAQGLKISASGVRYIWCRHGLETAVKRLQALARQRGRAAASLSEQQLELLQRGLRSEQLSGEPEGAAGADERSEREGRDRRNMILQVAAERFASLGYDRSSMRDIAAQAGLLPGSLYHYFDSKEALYLAVHREGFQRVMDKVQAAIAQGSDPWDRLVRAFTVHIGCMVGEGSAVDRLTGHSLALTGHTSLLQRIHADRDAYEQLIRELIADLPLATTVNTSLLRLFLLGAANWVYLWYREGGMTPQQIATQLVSLLRHGVEQPATPADPAG
ncbi:MAG: TetR family transcriptional regulator [Thiolinea sp.]